MRNHLCIQCRYYKATDNPVGYCTKLDCPVWSRRPNCATKIPDLDLFEPLDTLGNQLRQAREAAGLSRDEVCMELELSGRTLQNWELDTNTPPKHTVKMLMDFYDSAEKAGRNARMQEAVSIAHRNKKL